MKKDQRGSSIVVVLLALLVIAVCAGAGYVVFSKQNDKEGKSSTTSKSDSSTVNTKPASDVLEIPALSVKVNDPDSRNLKLHSEKICAAECSTEDSYFIRDDNNAYFDRCEYPAGVYKLDQGSIQNVTSKPNSDAAKHTKKIGNNYYGVTLGTNYQAPCSKSQNGDDSYQSEIRQYILDNLRAL